MINSVSVVSGVEYVSQPKFKGAKNLSFTSESNYSSISNGADIITNYRQAEIMLGKKFNIKQLSPISLDENSISKIKGEKIYTSDGNLHSIVDENNKTKMIYSVNAENPMLIDSISTIDKETGNIIRRQENHIEDGKYAGVDITEYSAVDGNVLSTASYSDGELKECTQHIYRENGDDGCITYYPEDNEYCICGSKADGTKHDMMVLSGDGDFATIYSTKKNNNHEISYNIKFYKGGMISYSETKEVAMPNFIGRSPLTDEDVAPAQKVDIQKLVDSAEDYKKTYYSNGALESALLPFGVVKYLPDGEICEFSSETKSVKVLPRGGQVITEKLGEDKTRTTTYFVDGSVDIKYENGDDYKYLALSENQKPLSYCEGTIDKDGTTFYYNQKGSLIGAFPC